jgi:hypothetical protein
MIEKALLIAAALLGGYASVTGSLPAAMVALFGNPAALGTASSSEKILQEIEGVLLGGPLGAAIEATK